MPTLHQVKEKESLIHLGQCLPRSIRRDQGVSHTRTNSSSSSIRKTFHVYVRVMDLSLGPLLAQNNDQNHEYAIYYLSRTMIGVEHRCNPIEKECLALVFAVQKMRHYLLGQCIHVISRVN